MMKTTPAPSIISDRESSEYLYITELFEPSTEALHSKKPQYIASVISLNVPEEECVPVPDAIPETKLEVVSVQLWRKVLIIICLAIAGFMVGLDQSIMGSALPSIAAEFRSLNDIGAYSAAYLLPQCALQPIFNNMFSIWKIGWVYTVSTTLFGIGSILSAAAPSSFVLIVGRTVSGIGAVGLSLGGLKIMTLLASPAEQNVLLGSFSLITGAAAFLGPVLGGVLTQHAGWRWIFWINLFPLAVILPTSIFGMSKGVPTPSFQGNFKAKMKFLDFPNTAALVLAIVPFLLALQFATTHDWDSALVLSMFVLSGVGVVAFTAREYFSSTLSASVLKKRNVWATIAMFSFMMAAAGAMIIYLPYLLQTSQGMSPTTSGLLTFAFTVSISITCLVFSAVSLVVPYFNPFVLIGTACFLVSSGLFTRLGATSSIGEIIGYQVLGGCGAGMAWLALVIFPRAVLDRDGLATALSYIHMGQMLGPTLSTQIASLAFINTLRNQLSGTDLPTTLQQAVLDGSLEVGTTSPELMSIIAPAVATAIKSSFYSGTAWAALAFISGLFLGWPRLSKGGKKEDDVELVQSSTI